MSETSTDRKFWGKYRGTVAINADPEFRGRVCCFVPAVLGPGVPSDWCEACMPLGGPGAPMGVYMVPLVGTGVWVEFENGDPNKGVWTGCRVATGDVPPLTLAGNPADPNISIQSLLQNSLMISDMPPSPISGGIILKSATGATIVVNDSGIYISNGKGATMTMIGPTIDFNAGALTIV